MDLGHPRISTAFGSILSLGRRGALAAGLRSTRLVWAILATVAAAPGGRAQPSGGPYGPIQQFYAPPSGASHVYYVAPDGRVDAPGTPPGQPTTLEVAITRVVTGDAIVMRGGVYRTGGLRLNQGITIQPYADEHPVIKGTRVATEWEALRDHVWRTAWTPLFPAGPLGWWQRQREGMRTPLYRFNNDMVFVDGELLRSVGWEGELDAHSFYVDYQNGYVYIGIDPGNHLVEITAWDNALVRTSRECHGKVPDHQGPVIRGITVTQFAYRAFDIEGKKPATPVSEEPTNEPEGPADPATYGKEVVGTTLENVTISFCSRVAGYFRGDRFTMRHCLVSDTGTEGVYVIGSSDVLLEKNIFRRNNIEQLTGYYPAAVKIFNQCHRVTCRDNLVIDQPYSNGIWYDVGNVDGVFVDNWVQGALVGFFFEISKGAVCAGNVFVGCSEGVRVLNSSNVRIYHNTFVNTPAVIERNERSATGDHFGWHPSTGPDVDQREGHVFAGNLLVADAGFRKPLLRVQQSKALCGRLARPQVSELDDNVYVRAGEASTTPLIVWSPAAGPDCTVELNTPADLHQLQAEFAGHSRCVDGWEGSVFQSPELERYRLARPIADYVPAKTPPADVLKLLGWSEQDAATPGAYPRRP